MKAPCLFFLLAITCILCTPFSGFAQIYPFRQYTSKDELANSNVYEIIQDKEGFLWFATERGISRFDGFKFTNYLFNEGLSGSIVYSIDCDSAGELYAATKYNGICKFTNGRFNKVVSDKPDTMINEQIAISGNILYSLGIGHMLSSMEMQSKVAKRIGFGAADIRPYCLYASAGDTVYAGTSHGIYMLSASGPPVVLFPSFTDTVYSITRKNDVLYAGGNSAIYVIMPGHPMQKILLKGISGHVNNILPDAAGKIWCSTYPSNRLFLIDPDDGMQDMTSKIGLDGASVNHLMEDNEGDVWVATYGKGAFCFHHTYCTYFNRFDGLSNDYITALATDSAGNLFAGTYNGAYYFNGDHFIRWENYQDALEYVRQIIPYGRGVLICESCLSMPPQIISRQAPGIPDADFFNASCAQFRNDTLCYSRWDFKISSAPVRDGKPGKAATIVSDTTHRVHRINVIYTDSQGRLWAAANPGLFLVTQGHTKYIDTGFLAQNVSAIAEDAEKRIFFGTEKGLLCFGNNAWKEIRNADKKHFLGITSLVMDNAGRLWIGTNSGLYLYDGKSVISIGTDNGLQSNEVNALAYDAGHNLLWVGTTAGLTRIQIDRFDNAPDFEAYALVRSMRTRKKVYHNVSDITLPYRENNFTLHFSAIEFSAPGGVKFEYKLDDNAWQPANGRQIEFASMPYGRHAVLLKAINDRGTEGPAEKIYITILTPYWATWWFRGLLIAISILIIYSIVHWRFAFVKKKQKEREALQEKIAALRHQALTSGMNPHFIFNALNSIQQFINTHNTAEASDYLGRFSRLIRETLEHGNNSFITLSEEMHRLTDYLELEKMRFGDRLDFKISAAAGLDKYKTAVPNMILQPLVENALWHGILARQENGVIRIAFSRQNGRIHVLVEDNGIGINAGLRSAQKPHTSMGIGMIKERLELLNRLNHYEAEIVIRDKAELQQSGTGTLVEVSWNDIPLP